MRYLRNSLSSLSLVVLVFFVSCQSNFPTIAQPGSTGVFDALNVEKPKLSEIKSIEIREILESANQQIKTTTSYTQKYYSISYPNGDVPKSTGACTDVVIRSFRGAGIDLQKEVHEDMRANFSKYPQKWGLRRPDSNIDHRRVPNLQRYFDRQGKSLSLSQNGEEYKPGDVISWDLNGKGLTHIGVVSNIWNTKNNRYLVIHNIGGGTELEDVLFEWKMTGHYRYF